MTSPGQVVTFYSYKGGTGRSMALANSACLLAQRRTSESTNPILVIDWDLEAPGLHRYFRPYFAEVAGPLEPIMQTQPGLLELMESVLAALPASASGDADRDDTIADEAIARAWSDKYLLPTTFRNLFVLKAGRFDDKYPKRVNEFDWEEVYRRCPPLFEKLAQFLAKRFSYVLIDSRTGHTDIGGICTMLMPQRLVLVFTPNAQNVEGVLDVGRKAIAYRKHSSDLRELVVFPLSSRIEAQVSDATKHAWRYGGAYTGHIGYQYAFETMFRESYGIQEPAKGSAAVDLTRYMDEVQIQHFPEYAYGEQIAVVAEKSSDRTSMSRSYREFVHHLTTLERPWELGGRSIAESEVAATVSTAQLVADANAVQSTVWSVRAICGIAIALLLGLGGAALVQRSQAADEVESVRARLLLQATSAQAAYSAKVDAMEKAADDAQKRLTAADEKLAECEKKAADAPKSLDECRRNLAEARAQCEVRLKDQASNVSDARAALAKVETNLANCQKRQESAAVSGAELRACKSELGSSSKTQLSCQSNLERCLKACR